jgi:putative NADH-flavin reductase
MGEVRGRLGSLQVAEGEAVALADKEKCEQFLLKHGFEKIEILENLRTMRMPPMSFSWHD